MNFNSIFLNLKIPLVVCEAETLKIKYINTEAKALLYVKINDKAEHLTEVLKPVSKAAFDCLIQNVNNTGYADDFILDTRAFSGAAVGFAPKSAPKAEIRIKINANLIQDEKKYICFYMSEDTADDGGLAGEVIRILSEAYYSVDTNSTINNILRLLGEKIGVSRVYIFESTKNEYVSNTYEWCADGITSFKETLLKVPVCDFNATAFMSDTGVVICNSLEEMSESEQALLSGQGVKALLTFPLFDASVPIGFIGCDDCLSKREWTSFEIQLLQSVSPMISPLIMRKKTQLGMETAINAMERVIDNIDAMVFVTDTNTNKVIYMNSAMARERGIKDKENEEIYCYQMFMRDIQCPCDDCENRRLFDGDESPVGKTTRTEFQSTINNKWYSMSTMVVEWINGEYVYLHNAVEITDRKNNEDILKRSASMDAMTNVYNREWGYKSLDKLISGSKESEDGISSIVFIDIDGLKHINDNYGHIEGDKIITGVVDALKKCTRKNDIIFRWGGDEFIILLPGCSRMNAESVMVNTTAILNEINRISVKPYKYAFSYGILEIDNTRETYNVDTVIKTADMLMYEQKNKKKQSLF